MCTITNTKRGFCRTQNPLMPFLGTFVSNRGGQKKRVQSAALESIDQPTISAHFTSSCTLTYRADQCIRDCLVRDVAGKIAFRKYYNQMARPIAFCTFPPRMQTWACSAMRACGTCCWHAPRDFAEHSLPRKSAPELPPYKWDKRRSCCREWEQDTSGRPVCDDPNKMSFRRARSETAKSLAGGTPPERSAARP